MENTPSQTKSTCGPTNVTFGVVAAVLLGAALLGAATLGANTFLSARKLDDVITVSGSSKQQVTSDSAHWTASFSRSGSEKDIKNIYAQMASDEKTVRDFFAANGFPNVNVSPTFMSVMTIDNIGTKQYTVQQNVDVRSNDVEKMTQLAKSASSLSTQGVMFQANPVEYYYSKLADLRVSLLPAAIADAKARAGMIAQSSGLAVSSVRSVSMGVVQVLAQGSVDVSDYGSYDTSSIDKDVMITVKATFGVK